jgi:uncharacterized protein DUF2867
MSAKSTHSLVRERGSLVYARSLLVRAPVERIFGVVEGIGGDRGWLFADWLWQLRGRVDQCVGGVGMSRPRRDPDQLKVGDVLDFWRVRQLDRNRFLRLEAEMRLPGRAWLQFHFEPGEKGTILRSEALFLPKGILGHLYWAAFYPAHVLLFNGLLRAIAAAAEN